MPRVFKASNVIFEDQTVDIGQDEPSLPQKKPANHTQGAVQPSPRSDVAKKIALEANSVRLLEKAKVEAEQIITTAKAQAQKIIDESERKAKQQSVEWIERSKKEGFEQGQQEAIAQVEEKKKELESFRAEIEEEKKRLIIEAEPQILDLISQIVDKLLAKAITIEPHIISNLIQQGLSQSTLTGEVLIRVSEADFEEVSKHREKIQSAAGSAQIEFLQDPSLKATDCVIETPFGNIDCSLDEQWKLLKKELYLLSDQT